MSLINDLLVNLEDRRGGQGHDSGVFAGLQAADAELARGTEHARPVVSIILVVGLLAIAAYFLWKHPQPVLAVDPVVTDTHQAEVTVDEAPIDKAVAGEASVDKKAVTTVDFIQEQPLLKLDDSLLNASIDQQLQNLPVVAEITEQPVVSQTPSDRQPRLQAIKLRNAGDALNIQLQLSALPEYQTYLLETPDRLVFDIQATEFMLESDDLPAHDWIQGIRHSRHGEELRLVFDLTQAVEIVDEQWVNSSDSKLLTLQLRAVDNGLADTEKVAAPATAKRAAAGSNDEPVSEDAVINNQHMSVTANERGRSRITASTYQQALRYYDRRDYRQAIQLIEMHLTDAPNDAEALKLYVLALLQTNQIERADKQLYNAIRRIPQATELKQIYAQRLMQQDKPGEALAVLEESPPPLTEAAQDYHALLAALLQQLGQHARSAELYQQLVQVSPERGVWWMGLAISLEEINLRSDALVAYRQALQHELSTDLRQYVSARISALSRAQNS